MDWQESLKKNFPGAVEGKGFTRIVMSMLKKQGIDSENTVFGYSTCPDEINRSITSFSEFFDGKEFPLGGLTGYPFVGNTGFGAFSHHAPDTPKHGNIVIMYAAHTGISESGEIGKVLRHNQAHDSSSCGAAFVFLGKYRDSIQKKAAFELPDRDTDPEQYMVEKLLLPHGERILNAKDPAKELVEANYRIIEDRVHEIVSGLGKHFEGKIVLVGGIMINLHESHPSYFQPRKIEIFKSGKKKDLMKDYLKENK